MKKSNKITNIIEKAEPQVAEEEIQETIEEQDVDFGEDTAPDDSFESEESLSKYELSPELYENYVVRIVNNHRNDLANAKIVTMWRRGKWSSKQKDTWAAVKKVSRETAAMLDRPADFLLTVNRDVWENLDESQRIALIDHELCHCRRGDDDKAGNPKWELIGHDIEEFYPILRRHGAWSDSVKKALEAISESKQVSMFDPLRAKQEVENTQREKDFHEAFPDAPAAGQ